MPMNIRLSGPVLASGVSSPDGGSVVALSTGMGSDGAGVGSSLGDGAGVGSSLGDGAGVGSSLGDGACVGSSLGVGVGV